MISRITEAECRAKANGVLDSFMVGSPDEIDLDTIAWRVGRLTVEIGELDTAEGRLVATDGGGVIRVSSSIRNEGRRRFTVAHEIGHYCLHGPKPAFDSAKDLAVWGGNSIEAQANAFAGELLMPERLFTPRTVSKDKPSLALIDALAAEFRASSLAAAVHYIMHTFEPCALVVSRDGAVDWFLRSGGFDYRINAGRLHHYSAAGEIHAGKSGDTQGMVMAPAGAWLQGFDPGGKENIHEDSRSVSAYGMVVTLLWADEEWNE
jgi:Zn-dependent peptidase ImmA (M78 family)